MSIRAGIADIQVYKRLFGYMPDRAVWNCGSESDHLEQNASFSNSGIFTRVQGRSDAESLRSSYQSIFFFPLVASEASEEIYFVQQQQVTLHLSLRHHPAPGHRRPLPKVWLSSTGRVRVARRDRARDPQLGTDRVLDRGYRSLIKIR